MAKSTQFALGYLQNYFIVSRFYNIAQSSLDECRYYLRLSKDLNYLTEDIYIKNKLLLEEVSRLLNSYAAKVSGS